MPSSPRTWRRPSSCRRRSGYREQARRHASLLQTLQNAALLLDAHGRVGLRIDRRSGAAPYVVLLHPLPRAPFLLWEVLEPGAWLLVQVIDPALPIGVELRLRKETFGLTTAEARVAALIASGLSAPKAAATLGLGPATVRTHLAHCFDKTGTRSQVTLARLVSSLAVGAPHAIA